VLTGSELGRWNTADRPFETGDQIAPATSDQTRD